MVPVASHRAPITVVVTLLVTGAVGLTASLALTLDKFALLADPNTPLSCNFSALVSCSTNLNSEQGAIFGFPNSLLGLMFWSAVIVVGVGLLAGGHFAPWFWGLFSLGSAAAFGLVVWFIGQSIFVLGVLCPWCMVTWTATIPLFLVVVFDTLRAAEVPIPQPVRRAAATAFNWIPLVTFAAYLLIAVLAQWRLDLFAALG
ncbi:MAG: vitamin K epoxide reductase family protein [Salinibacterium sp.]|nr:vitamin K epoxide reductase family protein [Salinibacterium sp.]